MNGIVNDWRLEYNFRRIENYPLEDYILTKQLL